MGRIAFPIYCYALAQGYIHTSSRPRYLAAAACHRCAGTDSVQSGDSSGRLECCLHPADLSASPCPA
ncbi:hypothetical protein ACFSQ7_29875 [Paenibacillus rhizoplanae]